MFLHAMWRRGIAIAITTLFILGTVIPPVQADNLPYPDPDFNGKIRKSYDRSEADFETLVGPQAPKDAPNIVLVLLDDVGFGASHAFGGSIESPTLDKLTQEGLSYNRFHTTALCAPTRGALLTGRNHHTAAAGNIAEHATGFPGYTGLIPQETATVAQVLQANGYSTSWFGKNHNAPDNQTSALGPFTRWPNDLGFDYFYGFLGGETDQFYPTLFENRNPVNPSIDDDPDYTLNHDLADKAINWMKYNHSLAPDTPFFLYFAPGATHAPHQPPAEYREKYKGKFDAGWDEERKKIYKRQKRRGIIPADAQLTERPDSIPGWDDEQFQDSHDLLALEMENYAGYFEQADVEVGRLLDAVDEIGETENTLVIYIVGDNGASAEGNFPGTCNEISNLNGIPLTMAQNKECQDTWGGPTTSPHYAVGWAWALDSPFRWTKKVASYFGGVRNPMVISWPGHIEATGHRRQDMRDQFLHVIDVAPTLLELAGIEEPKEFNGIAQTPIQGKSFTNTFTRDGADAKPLRDTQYFEMYANRGIYHNGWMASALHQFPWIGQGRHPIALKDDQWELFNLNDDFTQHDDLSADHPRKLKKMKALFVKEAKKNHVYPLDDRVAERGDVSLRPTVLGDRTHFDFYEGAIRLPESSAPNTKNISHTITASLDIPDASKVEGVILANGANTGGYTLYVNSDHKAVYEYNYFDTERTSLVSPDPLPSGENVEIKLDFKYDPSTCAPDNTTQSGCGGDAALSMNGEEVTSAHIKQTVPARFGIETQDVGMDLQSPTSKADGYDAPYAFTGGDINKVAIDLHPGLKKRVTAKLPL